MKVELRKIWAFLFLITIAVLLGSCEKNELIEPTPDSFKYTKSINGDDSGDGQDGNSDDGEDSDDITDDEDDHDDGDITDDEDDQDNSESRAASVQFFDRE